MSSSNIASTCSKSSLSTPPARSTSCTWIQEIRQNSDSGEPPRNSDVVARARTSASPNSHSLLGSARAQYHLRQCFVFLNMYPVNQPEVLIASAAQRFNERGELTDETSRELIRKLLAELVAWTKRLKG